MAAGVPMPPGTLAVSIPRSLFLSLDAMGDEPAPHPGGEVWTLAALAAWLLREVARGSESPWAPYLRLLPTYVPLPLHSPPAVLNELDSPLLLDRVRSCPYTLNLKPQTGQWKGTEWKVMNGR